MCVCVCVCVCVCRTIYFKQITTHNSEFHAFNPKVSSYTRRMSFSIELMRALL